MTLSRAMSKAQDLHPPRTLPKALAWDITDDMREAFTTLNRVRASLTSDNWPAKVYAFHKLFSLPVGEGRIQQLPALRRVLRVRLLNEEVKETLEAEERGDIVEVIDGLLDTIYVAIGWLIELGLTPVDINLAMEEVHASNMTKVDNEGKPIYDEGGKVLKGENYVQCNLREILNYQQGEE